MNKVDIKESIKEFLRDGDYKQNAISLEGTLNEVLAELNKEREAKEKVIAEARLLDEIVDLIIKYYTEFCTIPEAHNEAFINDFVNRKQVKTQLDIYPVSVDIASELKNYFNAEVLRRSDAREDVDAFDAIQKFCKDLLKN